MISQVQQSANNAFGPSNCTNTPPGTSFTPTWSLSGKFTVTSYTVLYWNGSTFVSAASLGASCTGYEPQQWTITIGSGSYSTTVTTVIYDPQAPPVTGGSTPYQLVFLEPSTIGTGTVNAAVSPQPIVAVEDQAGDIVYGDASSVTLTATGGTGTLSNCTGHENEGIISFSGCSFSGTGTYAVTATDSNARLLRATGPTGASYSISLAPPAILAFTTTALNQSASTNASMTKVTIQEEDAFHNADPGALTVNLASTSTATNLPSATGFFTLTPGGSPSTAVTSVPIGAGQSSVTVYYGDKTAGSYTFSAASAGLQTGNQAATINPAAESQLVFSTQPSTVPAGTGFSVGVTVQDQFGNTITTGTTGSTDSIKLTLSSTTVGFASGSTTTLNANDGVATFTGLKINTPGSYTITATDQSHPTTVSSATSTQFTVSPAPPSKLVFTSTVTGNHAVGATASVGPFVVQVQDQFGNAVANTGTPVSLLLQSSSNGTTFFTPTSGGSAGATVTIPTNSSSSAQFYYSDTASGTPTISVSATVNTFVVSGTTNGFTMTPGSATKLGITTQPPTSVAVHTNFAVGVSLEDQFGNTVTSSTDTVALTLSSGTMTGTTSKAAIAGVATFTGLQINTTGSGLIITATDSTHPTTVASAQSNPFSVTAGAPSKLVFTSTVTGNHPVGTTASVGPFAVQVQDSFGNPVTAGAAANLTLTSTSTGTSFFTPTSGGSTGVTVTIPSGSSTSPSFYYSDTKSGTPTITASATVNGSAVSGNTNGFTMTAGNAAQFNFTAVPTGNQPVGTTASVGPFTVQLEDAFGNPVNATATTTLNLGTTSVGTSGHTPFFTTTHLGTVTGAVTIQAGSANSQSFYYSDTLAGTPNIMVAAATVNGQNVTGDTANGFTMTAGNAKQYAFTSTVTGNQAASANANVGPFNVQLQDQFGNPVNVTANTTLTLGTTSAGTSGHTPFFTTTQGATTAHAVTIANGTSTSPNFYYSDTLVNSPTITVAAATVNGQAVTGTSTNGFTMTAGNAAQFNFTAVPTGNQPVGTTASVGPFTVQLEDAFGNPVNATATTTLNLGTTSVGTSGHTPFFTTTHLGTVTGAVTIQAGSANSQSFYYSDTLAGTPNITVAAATVNGQNVTGDTANGFTMTAGNAKQYAFTSTVTGNQAASANANVGPFNVQLQDQFGNPVNVTANTTLTLGTTSAGTSGHTPFFTTTQGATTAHAVTIANGTSTSPNFYYSDTLVNSPTITVAAATVNGQAVTGTSTNGFTIVGGAASKLVFTSTVTGNHPVGTTASVGPFAVQVQDQFGNVVINGATPATITLTSTSTGTSFFTPTSGGSTGVTVTIPSGSSTSPSFYYSDTLAGTPTITASATVNGSIATGTTNGFTMTAGNAAQFNFTVVPTGNQPVGTTASVGPFTVQLEDAFGNPVNATATTTLNLGTTSVGTSGHTPFFTTTHLGTVTGAVTIQAGSANSQSFYYSDTLAGTPNITVAAATVNGQNVTGDTANGFTMTAGNAKQYAFTSTVTGNQAASANANVGPFNVQLQDQFGNPVNVTANTTLTLGTTSAGTSGHTPFFTTTQGATTAHAVTIANGTSTSPNFYYSDTLVNSPTITVAAATVNGQAVTGTSTNGFTMTAGNAAQFNFTAVPTGNQPVGTTASVGPFTVQLEDAFGNPVNATATTTLNLGTTSVGTSGHTPFFTTTHLGTVTGAVTIQAGSANSQSFYYSDTLAGTPNITVAAATVNGQNVTGDTANGFTMTAGNAKQYAFTSTVTGNQAASANANVGPFNVQLQDQFGNPVNVTANTTLTLGTTSAGTSGHTPFFTTTQGATTAHAVTIANGTSTSPNFYYSDTLVNSPTITVAAATVNGQAVTGTSTNGFTMTAGNAAQFNFTAVPTGNQPVGTTASVGPFTVQLEDAFGNPVNATATTTLNLGTTSVGTSGHTPFFTTTHLGTVTGAVTIQAGSANSQSFYYSDTLAGTPNITVAAATVNGQNVTGDTANGFTMTAGNAAQFNFTAVPTGNQPVGTTASVGPFTVQLEDAFGNPVNATATTTLNLGTTSVGTSGHTPFFTTTHLGTVTGAVTIQSGSANSQSFYYSDTKVGTPNITVAAATVNGQNVTGDTANGFTMTAGTANSLSVAAATTTPTAGAGDNLTITALDSFGNIATGYSGSENLTFGGSNTGLNGAVPTVTNSGGTPVTFASATAITFVNGVSNVTSPNNGVMTLYKAGAATIVVSDGTINNGAGLSMTVGVGSLAGFGITAPTAVTAGTSFNGVVLTAQDAGGNTVTTYAAGNHTITWNGASTSPGGTGPTYPASTVSFTNGVSTTALSATLFSAGPNSLTATSSGTTGTATIDVSQAAAGKLVYLTGTQTFATGTGNKAGSGAISVQLQDNYGNPVAVAANTAITQTTTGLTTGIKYVPSYGSTTSCSATTCVIPAGSSIGTFYMTAGTTAGTAAVTTTVSGVSTVPQNEIAIAAGTPGATVAISAQSGTLSPTGTATYTVTVTNTGFGTVDFKVLAGGLPPTATVSPATCTSIGGRGQATWTVTVANTAGSTPAGTSTFAVVAQQFTTATCGTASGAAAETSGTLAITAGPASQLTIATSPATGTHNSGRTIGPILVQSQDAFGNPANVGATTNVGLSSTSATGTFATSSGGGTVTAVNIANGSSFVNFYYGDTAAGTPSITASSGTLGSWSQKATVN